MANVPAVEQAPILDFMMVRAPDPVSAAAMRRHYIRNWLLVLRGMVTHAPAPNEDPNLLQRSSKVGKLVFEKIFGQFPEQEEKALEDLLAALLSQLPPGISGAELLLEDLDRDTFLIRYDTYYLIPDRLDQLFGDAALLAKLAPATVVLEAARSRFDLITLTAALERIFDAPPVSVVFSGNGHSDAFGTAKRVLFDALYRLFVLSQWISVNPEPVSDGLRVLHVLEALAIDELYRRARAGKPGSPQEAAIVALFPDVRGWDVTKDLPGFPMLGTAADLDALLSATPVIHPIFARLFNFRHPFNDIKPIGIGDLKVVKQWLTAYRPGEISHIHNIMQGESKTRQHRVLEKSEDVFTLSGSRVEETTKDTQTTDRFEVKAEAENVIRDSLNVTANANLSYNNSAAMITASAGAGFGYTRASEDHTKTAQNFARDVVAKAIDRIETRTTSQRTTTKLFETEEKNRQVFNNVPGKGHVSGIYRWVDKEYTAQVFNYGKRLMFEFIVPEPATFWVKSRILAYENALDVPQPPYPEPTLKPKQFDFTWRQIDEARFDQLCVEYPELHDLRFPARALSAAVRDAQSRGRTFHEKDVQGAGHSVTYDCSIIGGATGYDVATVVVTGDANFDHQTPNNGIQVYLNERLVHQETRPGTGYWAMGWRYPPDEPISLTSDDASLRLDFIDELDYYNFDVTVELTLSPGSLERFQRRVFNIISQVEHGKAEEDLKQRKLAHDAAMAEYNNRLGQVEAVALRDLVAGGSDAANKKVMDEEIKKHCITMLTKEFDTIAGDDRLADRPTTGSRTVCSVATQLNVHRSTGEKDPTTVGYSAQPNKVEFPAIAIAGTRDKGSVVQFIEQAFEWQQLSYVFYPYFWAEQPHWIELTSRFDDVDPTFSAFLRAGMCRVLLAVTPGYNHAALHYLATRRPWCGKSPPAIGDKLFIALHEEMRAEQDDRAGGVPEGEPWTFVVPTSLVCLHDSMNPLPDLAAERKARAETEKEPRR